MEEALGPVGVFDSGVGGISVLREIRRRLPGEDVVYFGDTRNAPYGTKAPAEVLCCVRQVMDRLAQERCKAVVIACNTATSVAAQTLRETSALPIIGMEPALKPAAMLRHGGRILVMATPVTLALPKFRALMERYGEGAVPLPCPGLMDLVEQGITEGPEVEAYFRRLFADQPLDKTDAVVLGCTHYVFLRKALRSFLRPETYILDGGEGTARQLGRVLAARGLCNPHAAGGQVRFLTSGDAQTVVPLMERLAAMPIHADDAPM